MRLALRILRRVVVAPLAVVLVVLLWTTLPLWLIVAAALSPLVPGRWRVLRLLWMVVLYATAEAVMLVLLFVWWIASGFGWKLRSPWWERRHYDLVQRVLALLFREARRVLKLDVVTDGPSPDAHPGRPIIVACRHAGPGDSMILVHALMDWYDREPRVVLKSTLALDPAIDVLLNRLPARFITPDPRPGEDFTTLIGELATGLDENDAFVIFPEGGNFTPERRERAIGRLRRLGLARMADRAEAMTSVLAPRPGGLLAALDAAPDADVVLVAHTGLDHLRTVADLWAALPMDKRLVMRWWQVPRAEIPTDRDGRVEWLFGWWEDIDRWVVENRVDDGGAHPTGDKN